MQSWKENLSNKLNNNGFFPEKEIISNLLGLSKEWASVINSRNGLKGEISNSNDLIKINVEFNNLIFEKLSLVDSEYSQFPFICEIYMKKSENGLTIFLNSTKKFLKKEKYNYGISNGIETVGEDIVYEHVIDEISFLSDTYNDDNILNIINRRFDEYLESEISIARKGSR